MKTRAPWSRIMCCSAVAALLAVAVPAPAQDAARGDRYWALWRDGTIATGAEIKDWVQQNRPRPTLAGKPLFDPANPVRLWRDTRQQPVLKPPYLVLTNGDVLPGALVRYRPANPAGNTPAHVVVAMSGALRAWGHQSNEVAVRVDRLARFVGATPAEGAGPAAASPGEQSGAIVLADGRRVPVQALRWTSDAVKGLAADGAVSAALKDLAGLEMPAGDMTGAVLADATAPCPDAASPLLRLSTAHGAVLTCRLALMVPSWADGGRLLQFVQPAWALTAIGVPVDALATLGLRDAAQVPLSLLPAQVLAQKSFTGHTWEWRRQQSVRGGELACGNLLADLGLGTHSYSEIAFDLPRGAQGFTAVAGLDRGVGEGGCVKLGVFRDSAAGQALWQSGYLRGSDGPVKISGVSLSGARRLVLVTDFGHDGRPPGADPADIRDQVNWLWPMVEMDRAALPTAGEQWPTHFPALEGWPAGDPAFAKARLSAEWDARAGQWEPGLLLEKSDYVFTRQLEVVKANALLEIALPRLGEERRVELLVNGKPVSGTSKTVEDNNPVMKRREHGVMQFPLDGYVGRTVTLTLKIKVTARGGEPPAGLVLRGIAFKPAAGK